MLLLLAEVCREDQNWWYKPRKSGRSKCFFVAVAHIGQTLIVSDTVSKSGWDGCLKEEKDDDVKTTVTGTKWQEVRNVLRSMAKKYKAESCHENFYSFANLVK